MSKQLATLNLNVPISSLDNYIRHVNQIPLLTADEEQELAEKFYQEQDLAAARKLVLSHLRFVVSVARQYYGYGLAQADLIQEGNIGLMKAVKRFNPEKGVRLVSFAVHWIKAEIHEFILRNWRIVKIATTKAQRKLFFNLRKSTAKLVHITDHDMADVAEDLAVSKDDVYLMRMRLNARDTTFETMIDDDGDKTWSPESYLEDPNSNPALMLEHDEWSENQTVHLMDAIDSLDDRSREIIQSRWLDENNKSTLHDLAAKYQVSPERIRQIEKAAMDKIKLQIAAAA